MHRRALLAGALALLAAGPGHAATIRAQLRHCCRCCLTYDGQQYAPCPRCQGRGAVGPVGYHPPEPETKLWTPEWTTVLACVRREREQNPCSAGRPLNG